MKELNNSHIENDKVLSPFLLAASFNGLIKFEGHHFEKGILYWQFSSKKETQNLVEAFYTKCEPHIPARDLFEAIDTFWKQIAKMKMEGATHGY